MLVCVKVCYDVFMIWALRGCFHALRMTPLPDLQVMTEKQMHWSIFIIILNAFVYKTNDKI